MYSLYSIDRKAYDEWEIDKVLKKVLKQEGLMIHDILKKISRNQTPKFPDEMLELFIKEHLT
ncbi:16526_t:CDS:1, partial [Dentiscutata erythropus]